MTRTAAITRGASGLGLACAERLTRDAIEVITLDIAPGADIIVDVSDPAAVTAAAERIGPVDILINSAGIVGPNKPLWETSDEEWTATFAVNVTARSTCAAPPSPACGTGGGGGSSTWPAWRARTATPGSRPTRPVRRP